jgi:cob(I)alamin adenosyltransferase
VKIYTKTGDDGETSLFGGGRVPKSATRVVAYGTVDELNATVGWAAALAPAEFERELLTAIQADLFAIGARLATPQPGRVEGALGKAALRAERVEALERAIDGADDRLEPLRAFILPGGTPKAAALHLARTICRRAERAVVALHGDDPVSPEILQYLNRLSDLLFVLARLANREAGVNDRVW